MFRPLELAFFVNADDQIFLPDHTADFFCGSIKVKRIRSGCNRIQKFIERKGFSCFDALTIARLNEQVLTAQVYDHFQFQTEPVKICFRICPEIRIITADPPEKFFAEQDAVIRLC